jgi:hypothetical protein
LYARPFSLAQTIYLKTTTAVVACRPRHHCAGAWARQWPEAEFGPQITYREHTFLINPATPDAVKRNQVVVGSCEAGNPGCADGTQPATVKNSTVLLAKGLDSDRIKL